MSIAKFAFPTTIHFGAGAQTLVGPHLVDQYVEHVLIQSRGCDTHSPDRVRFRTTSALQFG